MFFFNDTGPTEIYTLPLRDTLPIFLPGGGDGPAFKANGASAQLAPTRLRRRCALRAKMLPGDPPCRVLDGLRLLADHEDRKSTRLNSSHANISYAVFCLKKKNKMLEAVYARDSGRAGYSIGLCVGLDAL